MKQPSARRRVLVLASLAGAAGLFLPTVAEARRRVRMSGNGLPAGARAAGPTLSRSELQSCVQLERSINERATAIDLEEASLKAAEQRVDPYSRRSVDEYNERVTRFNASSEAVNAQIDQFNRICAQRPYYEADMRAVENALRAMK
ncbi:MAG: hypothetical protein ACK515_03430 [bacterium]